MTHFVDDTHLSHENCQVSTGIHGVTTVGQGSLDFYGFWEYPCYQCARYLEGMLQEPVWPHTEKDLAKILQTTHDEKGD